MPRKKGDKLEHLKDYQIKKGQVLNPNGRPKSTPEEKLRKAMTKTHFQNVANKYLFMTIDELYEVHQDPTTPALDVIIIKFIIDTANFGNIDKMTFLLDRTIGKVQERLPTAGSETRQVAALDNLSVKELKELRRMAEKCQSTPED